MRFVAATAVALALCAGSASAELRMFEWFRPQDTVGYTDDAGRIMHAMTMYNTSTQDLSWQVSYDDLMTQGLSLILTPGDYPNQAGKYAVLFVDLTDTGDVRANVWAYNASNNAPSSIFDGTAHEPDAQPGDKILNSITGDTSWWGGATIDDSGGTRTISFSLNTALINAHTPLYDGPYGPEDWVGMSYGNTVGVWMHGYSGGLVTAYGQDGYLQDWYAPLEGFFDGVDIVTVPTPGTAALLGLGCLAGVRRRR